VLLAWRLLSNLFRVLTFPLWALLRRARKGPRWVELSLHGAVDELHAPKPGLRGLLSRLRPESPSVYDLRMLVDRMAGDRHVEGLLVNLHGLRVGFATLEALREAFGRLLARDKRVLFFLAEGGSQRELYVASASSEVCAPQTATFSLLGPRAQRSYVAPLLSRLGLRVEVLAQGRFKTAAEALVRSDMSDAEREQSEALVSALKHTLSEGLGARVGAEQVDDLFAVSLFGTEEAKQRGLLDRIAYRDELDAALAIAPPKSARPFSSYLAKSRPFRLVPLRARPRVAVLSLQGAIGNVSTGRSIALKPSCAALRALRERDDVRGVILHVDSPGGSASVSDLIHREVELLAKRKPVVAWMGNVAASGGYYIAAPAQSIVARPSTLTGSIGVISAHLVAGDLLDRVGIHQAVIKQTPHADFASVTRPLSERERELLDAQSARFYERFLEVVALGRKLTRDRVHELAQGRVWSGKDALATGLVDILGGFDSALDALRGLLGDSAHDVDFSEPLVARPAISGGLPWDTLLAREQSQAAALDMLESALGFQLGMRELLELARNHGPLLAYAQSVFDVEG
jgi:protease-4